MTEPCDFREFGIVRGLLLSPEACDWFRAMGIGWEIFLDQRCQVLAAWALGGCKGTPPKVEAALTKQAEASWSIAGWLVPEVDDFKPEWAMRDVQRYSRELASRWMPAYMHEQAEYITRTGPSGIDTITHAASHHRKVLDFIAGEAA